MKKQATCPRCSASRRNHSQKCFTFYGDRAHCHHCSFHATNVDDILAWFWEGHINEGFKRYIDNYGETR